MGIFLWFHPASLSMLPVSNDVKKRMATHCHHCDVPPKQTGGERLVLAYLAHLERGNLNEEFPPPGLACGRVHGRFPWLLGDVGGPSHCGL